MRAARFAMVFIALLASALVASPSQAQEVVTGHAELHPTNESVAHGSVDFTETAEGVRVTGTATGLQLSAGRYVSLVYDLGSVAGGPVACEPSDDSVGEAEMFIGTWAVDDAGSGTLVQLNPAVASLALVDTVSIRDTQINNGFGPEAVVACGQIAVHGGR